MSKCESCGTWISIRDKLPPMGQQVLFCCDLDGDSAVELGHFTGIWRRDAIVMAVHVDYSSLCTHWMQLPKTLNELSEIVTLVRLIAANAAKAQEKV